MTPPPAEPRAQTPTVYSVLELSQWIKDLLETDIGQVWVEGEVSGLKIHARSGHAYFSLRDETADALISCVAWASSLRRFKIAPQDGLRVRVHGYVSLWEPRGSCQFYVDRMLPAGEGDLHRAFLQLKARLESEGLFEPGRKRQLPAFPSRIGIATAPDGAALRDMLHILEARWPSARVFLVPTVVQGGSAVASIVRSLGWLQRIPRLDFIILGRGGGSLEDLWAFNEEKVARAVAASTVPVISAVGHEVDFTITDFVADVRAATPTHAAELSTPDHVEVRDRLQRNRTTLRRRLLEALENRRLRLGRLATSRGFLRPETRIHQQQIRLDRLADRLKEALAHPVQRSRRRISELAALLGPDRLRLRLSVAGSRRARVAERWGRSAPEALAARRQRLELAEVRLRALGPRSVLERGYGIVRTAEGRVLRRSDEVEVGEALGVLLAAGELECRVQARTLPGDGGGVT